MAVRYNQVEYDDRHDIAWYDFKCADWNCSGTFKVVFDEDDWELEDYEGDRDDAKQAARKAAKNILMIRRNEGEIKGRGMVETW